MAANPQPKFLDKPMSWTDLIQSQFIKADDLKGRKVTLTIAAVNREEMETDKGAKEVKGTVSFQGKDKRWALNRTTVTCLKEMFGPTIADWTGKRVTIYAVPFSSPLFPDVTEAIRVWGSPDLGADKTISIRLPRKKPERVVLHKTVREVAPASAADAPREPGQEG